MAHYILQSNTNDLDIENEIIKDLLKKNKMLYNYDTMALNDIKEGSKLVVDGNIPIGDIPFVTKFLNITYGLEKENPIEIPVYLRTDEFLKRDYKILEIENLPRLGNYFIKDVETLKHFSYTGYLEYLPIDEMLQESAKSYDYSLKIKPHTLYSMSSIFYIQSEYRVYIIDGEIEAIANYNGDCTILPDINLIKKMIQLINYNEKWLKSYTLDIMVGKEGTAIIEVHNFASVGLYTSLWGDSLLYAYKQGIEYLVNDNHRIVV